MHISFVLHALNSMRKTVDFLLVLSHNRRMKAITIWQPYTEAIKQGLKTYETRSWATKYRGPIVIHASKKAMSKHELLLAQKYHIDIPKHQFGSPVLICELQDCVLIDELLLKQQPITELDFGDWRIGRYAWKLNIIKILDNQPIIRGQQGLWNINI